MKVRNIYSFNVFDELKKGKDVRMIDYANASIIRLDCLTVSQLIHFIKKSEDNEKMYVFYELEEDVNNE